MKYTSENNLLKLVYRLIASGIILFICSEIMLAYVFAFHLLPAERGQELGKVHDSLRIGIEYNREMHLFDNVKFSKPTSLTVLNDTFEVSTGFKYELFDVIKTDQLTAKMLMKKYGAIPYAFVFNEETRKPLRERLVLITKNDTANFFEQTEGLKLVMRSTKNDIDHIIFSEFLNQRTGSYRKWFSSVLTTSNDFAALDMVVNGKADVAAVSELLYKAYLVENGKPVENLRVLWYSNPVCKNVIIVRKGLFEDQINQVKSILHQEDDIKMSWMLFDESLEELSEWNFMIRGKSYEHPEFKFGSGNNL